jgi:hypothetical protein
LAIASYRYSIVAEGDSRSSSIVRGRFWTEPGSGRGSVPITACLRRAENVAGKLEFCCESIMMPKRRASGTAVVDTELVESQDGIASVLVHLRPTISGGTERVELEEKVSAETGVQ